MMLMRGKNALWINGLLLLLRPSNKSITGFTLLEPHPSRDGSPNIRAHCHEQCMLDMACTTRTINALLYVPSESYQMAYLPADTAP